jgi:hypothetical protein
MIAEPGTIQKMSIDSAISIRMKQNPRQPLESMVVNNIHDQDGEMSFEFDLFVFQGLGSFRIQLDAPIRFKITITCTE